MLKSMNVLINGMAIVSLCGALAACEKTDSSKTSETKTKKASTEKTHKPKKFSGVDKRPLWQSRRRHAAACIYCYISLAGGGMIFAAVRCATGNVARTVMAIEDKGNQCKGKQSRSRCKAAVRMAHLPGAYWIVCSRMIVSRLKASAGPVRGR